MKHPAIILALALMSATAAHAEWRYKKVTDPLDDSVRHVLFCTPTNITQRIKLSKPVGLGIQISGGKPTVVIMAHPDFTLESTYPVTIRFDRKKAQTISCLISKEQNMLFPQEQQSFIDETLSSNGLIISVDTLLGHRTDFFDLRGLAETLDRHGLALRPAIRETEPAEQPEDRPQVLAPEPPPIDPTIAAKAKATLDDIANALIYTRELKGQMPQMKTERTLAKPLATLKNAIARHEQAAGNYETVKNRYDRLKPGNISRPSQSQLIRSENTLKKAKQELDASIDEIHEQARRILREREWPTPELSEDADTLARQIPYPRKSNHFRQSNPFRRTTFPSY